MNKEKNNKGFTLVEIVVVIVIMGIMTAVGGYALTMIAATNAKECAQEINAALISTRTQSYSSDLGDDIASVDLYRTNDGIYIKKSYDSEPTKIGGAKVKVSYQLTGGSYVELGTERLTFSFDRSSGAFRSIKIDGNASGMCESLQVISGGREYIITCYKQTGKTMLE